MSEPTKGARVILHGEIIDIIAGVALVRVDRTFPVGGTVSVQCGVLELEPTVAANGAVSSETDRIAVAVRAAKEHPGRVVTVEDADEAAGSSS